MESPVKKVRIAIVEDHPLFRTGIKSLIEERNQFEVVSEV